MINIIDKEVETTYLFPAALFARKEATLVHTVLGSCVSVCFFDKIIKAGGINHFMLPLWNGDGLPTPKYGNVAIEKLLKVMYELGSRKENLIAKVFGGGEVLENNCTSFNIGNKNIAMAMNTLNLLKIPIISCSTGGKYGRKIIFDTATGEVNQRYIKPQQ